MPSAFTHVFVAGAFGKIWTAEKMPARFWVLSAICAVIPDIDIIGFYYGIKYSDLFGHRGFFHSLSFALLLSVLVVVFAFPAVARFSKKWWGLLAFFFIVTASHGFLDSMTDKGMGVGFFIPFDNTRYHMPWRPIFASPMRISRFFSRTGLVVVIAEIIWIWIPLLLVYAGVRLYRKK
jgi:inner membrane protein